MILAAISGSTLLAAFVWIVIAAVIFFLLNWLLGYIGIPEPFNKVAKVIIGLVVVLLLINALLTIAGRPMIAW